jgi:hypothetical protein
MTRLETELALIGDHLQTAWRADARHARRRQHALVAAALATLLALTGAAIAADVFPINLTKTTGTPPAAAALRDLRATYQPPNTPLAPWQKALTPNFAKAIVIAKVTSRQTGPLSIIIMPAGQHSLGVDAARPDGTSYLGACANKPATAITGRGHNAFDLNLTVDAMTTTGVHHPALGLSIHTAPPNASRIDVRARNASKLPALITHGWLLFLNPNPSGAAVLVRVYDKAGNRLLSYYAP